ncbi:MAG: NRDE family protein [Myxococcota bacterium]
MCTLIAIHRRVQGAPLIVAANRDEYFDRPAEGPRVRDVHGAPGQRILAPRDLRAGGTWLGMNAEGVFAAVTNLREPNPDPHRRSRGLLVMDSLLEPTAARAADWLKTLSEGEYNPFHCFVADRDRAFHTVYRNAPRQRELEPGVHVIGNVDANEEPAPKADRIREQVEGSVGLSREQVWEDLAGVCRQHDTGDLGDICVHLGAYGTRSSALLMITDEGTGSRLAFSDGPPCENEYEDHSTLLEELSRTASYDSGATVTRSGS